MYYNADNIDKWWASRQKADNIQWVRISAELGEWLRGLARRDDLLAIVEPDSGKGHPAVYLPEFAHVEVNPSICAPGVDPADMRMDSERGRLKHAAFSGAGAHEGGHGAFSNWELDQNPKRRAVVQAALLLEESRMEKRLVERAPEVRVLLRAAFDKIVGAKAAEIVSPASAAHTLALAAARVDAGVLDADEVQAVTDACIAFVGQDRYEAFRTIWLEAHALPEEGDKAEMEALGQRWLDVLGDDAEPEEGPVIFVCGHPQEGDDGDEGDSPMGQMAKAVSEAAGEEAKDQVDAAEARDIAEAARKAAAEDKKDEKAAEDVFDKEIKFIGHGFGSGREGLSVQRQPTPNEYAQANVLAAAIQRARFRDRTKTTVASAVPPGRLRSNVAVRRSAERSMGMMATAQPWKQTVRKSVPNPPIVVAIGCDISGSMRMATEAVASAAWVIANAVHRAEGNSATVAYGERVHAVVKPGETPKMVREFGANGGFENIIGAIRALNGALHLDNSRGVRLAVFISDGHYTHAQREQGDILAKRLADAGVKILHIGFDGKRHDVPVAGAKYVHLKDPANIGKIVGDAMIELLEAA